MQSLTSQAVLIGISCRLVLSCPTLFISSYPIGPVSEKFWGLTPWSPKLVNVTMKKSTRVPFPCQARFFFSNSIYGHSEDYI